MPDLEDLTRSLRIPLAGKMELPPFRPSSCPSASCLISNEALQKPDGAIRAYSPGYFESTVGKGAPNKLNHVEREKASKACVLLLLFEDVCPKPILFRRLGHCSPPGGLKFPGCDLSTGSSGASSPRTPFTPWSCTPIRPIRVQNACEAESGLSLVCRSKPPSPLPGTRSSTHRTPGSEVHHLRHH